MQDSTLSIISHSANETQAIGAKLGRLLQTGDVVCLQGDLGSGKTCLTQGIGRGMSVTETINSPTFVYIHEHRPTRGTLILNHVDLYRLEQSQEALALGLTDYIYGDGITVIEWAERAGDLMPQESLWIIFTILDDTQRNLVFKAVGAHYLAIVADLQQKLESAPDSLSATDEVT